MDGNIQKNKVQAPVQKQKPQIQQRPVVIESDVRAPVRHLVGHRLPWLILGLLGGFLTTFIVSQFERIISTDIRLAFFIPIVVYMSDAVGTQTETIFVRYLHRGHPHFIKYMIKETLLGLSLGVIFGFAVGIFAALWLRSIAMGITVGLAMFINILIAPVVATLVPTLLYKERTDPALGAGPLTTILQDLLSLVVYLAIATLIILH